MANEQLFADLAAEVSEATTVMESATRLIDGFAQRVEQAVADAAGLGATQEQLEPIQRQIDALHNAATILASAVRDNTGAV